MNPAHLPDQIEQWLHDKDAESLTSDEQELVIQALGSLEAYRRLRLVASRSQEALNAGRISPAGSTLGTILSKVAVQEPEHPLPRIRMAIPLHQAAASVLLAVALTWWWATSRPGAQPEPVVITLVDTVYQEVVRVDTIQLTSHTSSKPLVNSQPLPTKEKKDNTPQMLRNITPTDYRFARGDYPITSAIRAGQSLREQTRNINLDSIPGIDCLFVPDKVL